jgi:hypothetical protein
MEFIGCSVFVDCGTFGTYQGKVAGVDATTLSLTLSNVMKDGEFVPGNHVLHSAEIVDIKVLKMGTARDRGEILPQRHSKTVAIKGKFVKNASSESQQSTTKASPIKTQKEKVLYEKSKDIKPVEQMVQTNTNLSDNGFKIMQQLLLAPVSNTAAQVDIEKHLESKIISPPPKQTSTPIASDMLFKQKENQKPKSSPMIPTAAIKILKRGEPFPVQSANGKQQSTNQKCKPEADDAKPQIVNAPCDEQKKDKKKNNRKSKKSESEKSQITSESVAELSEGSLSLNTTQSSTTVEAQSSANADSETSLNIEYEKAESVGSVPTPIPGGIKIDPLQLISSLAAPSSVSPTKFATSTPKKMVPQRSLSVNDQPVSKPQYEKFGDFKRFTEKQAPTPCNLNANNQRPRGNTTSPSGVPTKDFVNGYGKVHKRNRELDGPIDHNAFKDDFDFTGNLALMVKEEDEDDSTGDSFEPPAHIRNYRNDENILSDSSRVISWTSTIHEFQHSAFADTKGGLKIPILTVDEKKKFLNIVAKSLGNEVFNASIADRLTSMILEIVTKNSIEVQNVVVIGSSDTSVSLVNRLAMHLSNRKYHSYFVNFTSQIPLHNIEFVDEDHIKTIVQNIQIVILLENVSNKLELSWLNRVALGTDSAHVISLEQDFPQYPFVHSLYLGTLVEQMTQKRKNQNERFVADLGIPFSWFKEEAKNALCEAFSKSTIISI